VANRDMEQFTASYIMAVGFTVAKDGSVDG
jgi:hypothetical protein